MDFMIDTRLLDKVTVVITEEKAQSIIGIMQRKGYEICKDAGEYNTYIYFKKEGEVNTNYVITYVDDVIYMKFPIF